MYTVYANVKITDFLHYYTNIPFCSSLDKFVVKRNSISFSINLGVFLHSFGFEGHKEYVLKTPPFILYNMVKTFTGKEFKAELWKKTC